MPIIKSSSKGNDITVVVFNKEEIEALVTVLSNSTIDKTAKVLMALSSLEDLYFALDIPYDIN